MTRSTLAVASPRSSEGPHRIDVDGGTDDIGRRVIPFKLPGFGFEHVASRQRVLRHDHSGRPSAPAYFPHGFRHSPRSTNRQCPAKLIIAGRTAESLTSNLGARCARPINGKKGALEARAIWSHELGDADSAVMGRLAMATTGGTFTVAGVPIKRDALTLGAGISNECAGTSCSSPTTVPSWTAAGRLSSPSMRDCGRRGRQPAGRHVGCLVSLLH